MLVREHAARALLRISPMSGVAQGARLLEKKLTEEDLPCSTAACLLLFDADHRGAKATLRRLLQEERADRDTRLRSVLAAIDDAGPAARELLADVQPFLQDRRPLVRVHAAGAVWRISNDGAAALPVLIASLDSSQKDWTRVAALDTLAKLGPAARAALPAIRLSRLDRCPRVRSAAAKAIDAIDPPLARMLKLSQPD
jgi:hypothetical protein